MVASTKRLPSSEHSHRDREPGSRYVPHHPEQAVLYQTVREQLETFLATSRKCGRPAPRFVEQELRAFLRALFAELKRRAR
jgi:hypothetical protein